MNISKLILRFFAFFCLFVFFRHEERFFMVSCLSLSYIFFVTLQRFIYYYYELLR